MLRLAEYRTRPAALADFLPWAALVAPGVVLNKDGSLQRSAGFRGPDLDSATPTELVATSARLNAALRRLGRVDHHRFGPRPLRGQFHQHRSPSVRCWTSTAPRPGCSRSRRAGGAPGREFL